MNKRRIITNLFSILTIIFSLYSFITIIYQEYNSLNLLIISVLPVLLFTLFIFRKKIINNIFKKIYNTVLITFSVCLSVVFIYFLYLHMNCVLSNTCSYESNLNGILPIIYPSILLIMLVMTIINFKEKTSKSDDILLISVSLIVSLIHLRYYLNIDVFNTIYITQNYIYFFIMYLVLLVRKIVNKI